MAVPMKKMSLLRQEGHLEAQQWETYWYHWPHRQSNHPHHKQEDVAANESLLEDPVHPTCCSYADEDQSANDTIEVEIAEHIKSIK